ncbi:hypothetical protein ACWXVL_02195 [Mycoplasma sp. 128]
MSEIPNIDQFESFSDEIKFLLDKNEMSQKELALRLGLSLKHVNSFLNEDSNVITTGIIEGLEFVFQLPNGSLWRHYQLYRNRKQGLDMGDDLKIHLESYGVKFLIKNPQLLIKQNIQIREEMEDWRKLMLLKEFYGVNKLENYKEYLEKHILAESKKYYNKPNTYVWIRFCELGIDHNLEVGNFRNSQFKVTLKKVLNIMSSSVTFSEKIELLKHFLASKGIVLVTKKYITGAKIRGITLKKRAKRYIFLNDIYNRESFIFFNLLHEIIHCYLPDLKEEEIDKKVFEEYDNWESHAHTNYKAIYDAIISIKQITSLREKSPKADISHIWETIQQKYESVSFEEE